MRVFAVLLALVGAVAGFAASAGPAWAQKLVPPPPGWPSARFVLEPTAPVDDADMAEMIAILTERARGYGALVERAGDGAIVVWATSLDLTHEDVAELRALITRRGAVSLHEVLIDDPAEVAAAEEAGLGSGRAVAAGPGADGHADGEADGQGERLIIDGVPIADGSMIAGADVAFAEPYSDAGLRVDVTPEGRRRICAASRMLEGRRLAMVVDGELVSAPMVHAPICDESIMISGGYTLEAAHGLVRLIELGELAVDLRVVEETVTDVR